MFPSLLASWCQKKKKRSRHNKESKSLHIKSKFTDHMTLNPVAKVEKFRESVPVGVLLPHDFKSTWECNESWFCSERIDWLRTG